MTFTFEVRKIVAVNEDEQREEMWWNIVMFLHSSMENKFIWSHHQNGTVMIFILVVTI